MSLASRSTPVPHSPLAPYPCEARVRNERQARLENGARSERGTGTEREWDVPARGVWRRPRGARKEGESGRHQLGGVAQAERRKLRGVRVGGLPKKSANNPKSLRVNRRSPGIPFRLRAHWQVTAILSMINC
jgi:hypothetical protein